MNGFYWVNEEEAVALEWVLAIALLAAWVAATLLARR